MPEGKSRSSGESGLDIPEPVRLRASKDDDRAAPEESAALDAEREEWEREDREDADEIAAIERRISAQTTRIVELEGKWRELGKLAASQAARTRELDVELTRLRGEAAEARAERRAASAELVRAGRRAAEAGKRADESERKAVAEENALAEASARLRDREAETQTLAADLAQTQAVLQARSEQLGRILRSRWFRLARSAWRARQRRPPIGTAVLAVLAIAAGVLAIALAGNAGTAVAGLLGAAMLAAAAVAYAVVVPALRDRQIPQMAGGNPPARPREKQGAAAKPTGTQKAAVRLVPAPNVAGEADVERLHWLGGSRVPGLRGLRVAGVLDAMSRTCFAPECSLDTGFGASDWRERLEAHPPHLLLVESAWSGNEGGWQYCVASYPHPRYAGLPFLRELVAWCREQGIPTVFWNKEDPVHFDRFKEAATLFDHVFTTDADCVPTYEALEGLEAKTVEVLQFAAQPRIHNPIPIVDERRREPVFAGTYYRDRHPDRRRSLEAILDAARPRGLMIYDRTFGSDDDAYGFPERFSPHVVGRLSYEETVDAYKRHCVFLNANSVSRSPTMFSRRVFELLACGTAVLSTESAGMEALFGDLVAVAKTKQEAEAALAGLIDDDDHRRALARRAQHLVLTEHTYRDRIDQIARTAGFDLPRGEGAAALVVADGQAQVDAAANALRAQSTAPEEVLLGLGNGVPDCDLAALSDRLGVDRVRSARQQRDTPESERLRELAALATTPWVAPFRPGARYGKSHLGYLLACSRFADAQVIGLGERGADEGGMPHRYDDAVSPDTAIADRGVVASRGWPRDGGELRDWFAQGVRIYAGDSAGE